MLNQAKIAIVGVAAQLPSGDFSQDDLSYRTFWDFLINHGQAYEPLRPELFSSSSFGDLQSKLNLPAKGSFLKNPDGLDTIAFGISGKDARVMPFTARRLMELSFEALLDSGVDYRNQKIGCFMSGMSSFELEGSLNMDGSFASVPSALANRISYLLDIIGPSVQVDTACSSSLTALHLAILAIEAGDCSAALVGAAQINRELAEWKNYVLGGVLSPSGTTKPFDAGADGFGRGEGVMVVVVKLLEDALRDNDHIYAVVLGSAINSTGSRMPLNVPNAVAQTDCIEKAYARAGRKVSDVDYAELHVTGTSIGDPIESNGAGKIFARGSDLVVGSVKGNIGHLEAAAFLVSLLKACLILEKKTIPPTVNLAVPSPAIDWQGHRLFVATEPTSLGCRSDSGRSVVSVSAAGIGGSTGHVVIESPPEDLSDAQFANSSTVTFVVGGLSPRTVTQICQSIRDADITDLENMRACAVTLSRRARQLPWRTHFTMPMSRAEIPSPTLVPTSPPPMAFIFSGQGPQNLDMGRGLFAEFPVFRSTILELDDVYRRIIGASLLQTTGLFVSGPGTPSVQLSTTGWPVIITVASIAMLQMALFDLLKSVGVAPGSLAGHSAGETALLYTSGAGSKAMALEIAIARGQAMTVTESEDVGMASLACNADVAAQIVARISHDAPGFLEISCFNSPDSVAISGSAPLLTKAIALAKEEGYLATRIATMVPGHSSAMDEIKDDYMSRMTDIFKRYPGPHIPVVPVFSTCREQIFVDEFSPSYFWDNCRNPVRFSPAIANLLTFHADTDVTPVAFIEISCHAVLSSSILRHGVSDKSVLCPMRRTSPGKPPVNEPLLFTETVARITLLGYNSCDFSGLYGPSVFKPSFINHPFAFRSIPPPKTHFSHERRDRTVISPLSTANPSISELTHPLLAQHVINGEPILPATGFIEILLEAGANFLWDVEFMSLFSLSARNSARIMLERSGDSWTLKSSHPGQDASMTADREHARGLMDTSPPIKPSTALDLQAIWDRLPSLEIEGFYKSLEPLATFGPAYRRILRCSGGPSEVLAEIQGLSQDESSDQYRVHPVVLDACLHIMLHPEISKQNGSQAMYLPSKLERFVYHGLGAVSGNWFSHITRQSWSPDAKSYDIVVTDSSGSAICELRNLVVQKLSVHTPAVDRRLDLIFQPVAIPTIVSAPHATYSQRESQLETEILFKILDSLAVKMIEKSLQSDISVGSDVSRQRYFEFAKRAVRDKPADSAVPADDGILRTKYPAHFTVTERIANVHETVFNSSKKAVDSLYSDDLMTRFYSRKSQTSTVYPEVVKSFSSLLDALQASGKRAINILEVGAGTGLLTNYLIDVLKQTPDLLAEYTVTDASYALAAELARNIAYNKVTPKIYDLTKPPSSQGLFPESYDVVVALHVLHAVPDVHSCLSSLQSLLVPGGSLFVVELDGTSWETKAGSVWFDCIFGSFPEWFGYADGRTKHCTMTPSSWLAQLGDLGFVNNHASVEGGDGGHNFLFSGQKPSSFIGSTTPESESAIDPRHILRYSFGNEMDLRSSLAELSAKDRLEVYLVSLAGRDGDAVMGLIATLEREFPFWDVRLAIFESATHLENPAALISNHLALYQKGEHVIHFPRDGSPRVPRVVLSSAPHVLPDTYSISLNDSDHLIVEIITLEATAFSVHGFVGRVVMSRRTSPVPGDFVAGITEQAKGSVLVVHTGGVVSVNAEQMRVLSHPGELVKLVAPILVSERLPKRSGSPLKVLVAVADKTMSTIMTASLKAASVSLVQCDFKDGDQLRLVDVVISDLLTKAQYPHIRRWVPRSGRFILWDTLLREKIRDGSSDIAQALELGLQRSPPVNGNAVPHDITKPATHWALFLHDKSYLLLGGIGGLGVDLAVWMYQHGARHIILTSRRGIASLDPERDAEALSKIAYLERCGDLVLRLEQCDATDSQATSRLIKSLPKPLAGCFQMTLVLSDALFLNQTPASFAAVHDGKIKVFEVFAAEVDITSLDFYVAFSSLSGLTGSPGQSNYASACTVLDGILAHYPNAFSLVVPGVRDVGYLDREASVHVDKANAEIFAVTISAARLWTFLEDGLQMLKDGSTQFNQYIPDLDWNAFHARLPLPAMFNHLLVPQKASDAGRNPTTVTSEDEVLQIVLSLIEVEKEDFDPQRPLLSYGLDSLSATRLSLALQPFVPVSQVQLLAGVSWSELRVTLRSPDEHHVVDGENAQGNKQQLAREVLLEVLGIDEADFDSSVPLISYGLDSLSAAKLATALRPYLPVTQLQLLANTTWADLQTMTSSAPDRGIASLSIDTIVELRAGDGIPLIAFSGGDGSLAPLLALRTHFPGAVWGIQVTDTTPTATFSGLATFYAAKIREKQPHGPYRVAAYSASSVISVAVVKLLEASGEQVRQLTFIDGFPGLWTSEETELLLREQEVASLVDRPIISMIDMLKEDPLYANSDSIPQLQAALSGSPDAAQTDIALLDMTRRLVTPLLHFLVEFYPRDGERTYSSFADPFTKWYSSVEAPFSLLVAETGTITTLPVGSQGSWAHLGAHLCGKSVEVHVVPGVGHYGILGDEETAAVLERWA
ncbi:hypothetical protein B0H17DRAFT_1030700 [Mycena rosella]|uniref:Polyketide synthase n=1 Tax=Mycena rosella TaxID=1033263 RepID=A0AAD7GZN4_MYCRO|nr:hypothetical protein B0H17DRAFT_1030700 [Mycena rosella]